MWPIPSPKGAAVWQGWDAGTVMGALDHYLARAQASHSVYSEQGSTMSNTSTSFRTLVLSAALLLVGASPLAFCQVYSWVDENGKKHFGDRIPEQYRDQGSEYEMGQTNSSDAVKPQARPQPKPSSNQYSYENYKPIANKPASNSRSKYSNPNSCEAQKEAYARAQACWSRCREYRADGSSRINASGSACRGCSNMKKPSC